jgi:putative transposase
LRNNCATDHDVQRHMARVARIVIPGLPHHLVQRGHDRKPCFFSEADRRWYLAELGDAARQFGCEIHAYVLMTNHVHVLATPVDPRSLWLTMKRLNQRYVRRINRRLGRTGTLWEGRYKSCVVDSDSYLLSCYRYVERNPVRAGMTTRPADHLWSSHRANATGEPDPLVVPHAAYLSLATTERRRQAAYAALFLQGECQHALERIREATRRERPLGGDDFLRRIESLAGVDLTSDRRGGSRKGSGRPSKTRKSE